jgi:hypothetical protein
MIEWFSENWAMFAGTVGAFFASLVIAFKIGEKNNVIEKTVSTLEKDVVMLKGNQVKFFRAIPRNVIDGKDTIATINDCTNFRNTCGVHVITEELIETMKIVKQAVSLIIIHNDKIPQADRDEMIKKLVK